LEKELANWLENVGNVLKSDSEAAEMQINLPNAGTRAIIAPHAGYAYSGPTAAYAYKALDASKM